MTQSEIIRRLNDPKLNRAEVSRKTGVRYMYLYELAKGRMKRPGAAKIDALRHYFLSVDTQQPPQ